MATDTIPGVWTSPSAETKLPRQHQGLTRGAAADFTLARDADSSRVIAGAAIKIRFAASENGHTSLEVDATVSGTAILYSLTDTQSASLGYGTWFWQAFDETNKELLSFGVLVLRENFSLSPISPTPLLDLFVPLTRILTIGGVSYDLSADRTWVGGSGFVWGTGTGDITTQTDLVSYVAAHSGTPAWGALTGTLSNQTDLATALAAKQPLDATLTALATLTIAANSLTIGTAADTFAQTTFAANTFPARASSGNLVAKAITDTALTFLAASTTTLMRTAIGAGTGSGDTVGPASATDNAIARFDSTTGKLLQNSSATIDDSGQMEIVSILASDSIVVGIAGQSNVELGTSDSNVDPVLTIVNAGGTTTFEILGNGTVTGGTYNGNTIGAGSTSGTNTGDQATISGNAGTATILATGRTISMTGDVTWTSGSFNGSGNVTAAGTIAANAVTLAKMAAMATASLLGRSTAGTGIPEVLSASSAKTLLSLNNVDNTSDATKNAAAVALTNKTSYNGLAVSFDTNNLVLSTGFFAANFPLGSYTVASSVGSTDLVTTGTLTAGATGAGFTIALTTSTVTGLLGTARGGTGVSNNAASTITISGNFGTTFTVTGTTAVTLPTSGTLATLAGAETFSGKRITKRTGTTTSSATPTINTDNVDIYSLTAQIADITSFTTNISGTPTEGQTLIIKIVGTASRAIVWGASFAASGTVALPTTTSSTTMLTVGFIFDSVSSKFVCVAVA